MTVFIISCGLNIRSSSCKTQKYFFSTGSLFVRFRYLICQELLTILNWEEGEKERCRYRERSLRLLSYQQSSPDGPRDSLLMYDLLVEMIVPVMTSPMKGANSINRNDTGQSADIGLLGTSRWTDLYNTSFHFPMSPSHLQLSRRHKPTTLNLCLALAYLKICTISLAPVQKLDQTYFLFKASSMTVD